MKQMIVLTGLALLTGVTFVGCDKNAADKQTDRLDSVAFAIVDGTPLTAAQVRDAVLITARIRAINKKAVKPDVFTRWANNAAMSIVPNMVSGMLIADEATRKGVKVSEEVRSAMLTNYNRMVRGKAENVDELAAKFGELGGAFRSQFERECLFNAYFKSIGAHTVTDAELKDFYQSVSNRIRMTTGISRRAHLNGEAAWKALNDGEKWADVAKEYNEEDPGWNDEADPTVEWETFRLKDFFLPEVATALVGLQPGQYTRPLETEAGLMIVKVLKLEDGVYTCARIFFRLPKEGRVPAEKQAVAILRKRKTVKMQLDVLRGLRETRKVEYPLGTNFVYKIWDSPEKPKAKRGKSPKPPKLMKMPPQKPAD